MKKLLMLVTVLMLSVCALPLATLSLEPEMPPQPASAGADAVSETEREEEPQPAESEMRRRSYDRRTCITLCRGGDTVELSLYDYLSGVLAAEMPANFPEEALKAQALAARTYTLYKLMLYDNGAEIPPEHNGAQMCDDYHHCKAFCDIAAAREEKWGADADYYEARVRSAVEATDGLVAICEGEPIAAVFHAASGSLTESAEDVWGAELPYLTSVESPGGEASPNYSAEVRVKQADFAERVLEKYPQAVLDIPASEWFKDSHRSEAGGVIDVLVGGVRVKGSFVREIAGLNSTNFRVSPTEEELIFTTTGYGHCVGMSQYGARELALEGKTFDGIIRHYFTGVELMLKT